MNEKVVNECGDLRSLAVVFCARVDRQWTEGYEPCFANEVLGCSTQSLISGDSYFESWKEPGFA